MGAWAGQCPVGLPDQGCRYSYGGCHDGSLALTLHCADRSWSIESPPCSEGDFCDPPSAAQMHCIDGAWTFGQGGEQQGCSATRPPQGAFSPSGNVNYLSCGYRCGDGTWSVGRCDYDATGSFGRQYSPPCAEDAAGNGGASGATER